VDHKKIQELENRIAQLEEDVKRLMQEKVMEAKAEGELGPPENRTPRENTKEVFDDNPSSEKPKVIFASEKKKKEPIDWEFLIGKVWLPRIFIFVLLLGIVWGFKIAVDAGWLNETARIILGFVTAAVFYFFGNKQMKEKRSALGIVLFVGSISTLMVTTFAMNVLYNMIPNIAAFLLNLIWVGLGIYLADRHHSQVMGIMFAIAGYLIPFLTEGSGTETTLSMVIGYELIYYVALLWFAIKKQYRILFYVSTVFLHVIYLLLNMASMHVIESLHIFLMALGILVQHEVIFVILLKGKLEKIKAFPVLFSSFLVTLLWVKIGFEIYDPAERYHLYTVYLFATTSRYALMAYKEKQNAHLRSITTVITTMGLTLLLLDVVENEYMLIASYLVEGVLAFYIGYIFRSKFQKAMGLLIFYLTAVMMLEIDIYHFWSLFVWILLIVMLYFLVIFNRKTKDDIRWFYLHLTALLAVHPVFLMALPYAHHLFSLTTAGWIAVIGSLYYLYQITKEDTHVNMKRVFIGENIIIHLSFIYYIVEKLPLHSTNTEVFALTIGWALYALACVYIGMEQQNKTLRLLGIGLILLTLCKLILFDLAFISVMTRAFLFMIVGGIGILLSRLVYGKNK
jgi:uncharacterized membrane protein